VTTRVFTSGIGRMRNGVSGIGDSGQDGLHFADNAVIAPQFQNGRPGRYAIEVIVVGVPMAASKLPFLDVAEWNQSLRAASYGNVTVERIEFVRSANPRSSGGPLDIWGWGEPLADLTYRLVVNVYGDTGVGGLGLATIAWVGIAAVAVAVNLLIYKLSGTDVIVSTVRWLGTLVGTAGAAAGGAAVSTLLPVLALGAVALFAFVKLGGRGSYKGFTIGGPK